MSSEERRKRLNVKKRVARLDEDDEVLLQQEHFFCADKFFSA